MLSRGYLIASAALILFLALAAVIFSESVVTFAARRQFQKVFSGSSVVIGNCTFSIKGPIVFCDIEIKREGIYDIKVKKTEIFYRIPSVFTGSVDNIIIKDLSVNVNSPLKNASQLKHLINVSTGGFFRVNECGVSRARLNIKARDIELIGRTSLRFYPVTAKVGHIKAAIDKLESRGVLIEDVYIKGDINAAPASLTVGKIKYNKAVINNLRGSVYIGGQSLSADSLTAELFDGIITGYIKMDISENGVFSAAIACSGLDLSAFIEDFGLSGKMELTGKSRGSLFISGKAYKVVKMHGDFFAVGSPEGSLVIKDTRFIENMTKEPGQSMDIVMENFRNYKYTIGVMRVNLDEKNLVLNISLEGKSGKRVFDIVFHDIFK